MREELGESQCGGCFRHEFQDNSLWLVHDWLKMQVYGWFFGF